MAVYSRKIFQVMVKLYIPYSMVYHIIREEILLTAQNCPVSSLLDNKTIICDEQLFIFFQNLN